MFRAFIGIAVLIGSAAASAADSEWDIKSVSLRQISDELVLEPMAVENDCSHLSTKSLDEALGVDLSQIISVGERVWAIVQANHPVVTVNTPVAHALPRGVECWADLERWQAPRARLYEVTYQNGFGTNVVHFRFRLQYTYGGGKDGRGRYLANVAVIPADLDVLWGYTFDANVEVGQAVNLGTHDDPVAGLGLNVKWNVKTVLKDSSSSMNFFVQGDGIAKSLN